jgi:hypothetical protein
LLTRARERKFWRDFPFLFLCKRRTATLRGRYYSSSCYGVRPQGAGWLIADRKSCLPGLRRVGASHDENQASSLQMTETWNTSGN